MPALKANNQVSIAVGLVMPDRRCPSEAYTDTASHTMLFKTNPVCKGYRVTSAYVVQVQRDAFSGLAKGVTAPNLALPM